MCAALLIPQLSFAAANFSADRGVSAPEAIPSVDHFSTLQNLNEENPLPGSFNLNVEIPKDVFQPESLSSIKEKKFAVKNPIELNQESPIAEKSSLKKELQNRAGQKFSILSALKSVFKKSTAASFSAQDNSAGVLFDGENLSANALDSASPDQTEQAALMALLKSSVEAGTDLESWGLPNSIAVKGRYLRYAKLYRMGGQATDLGIALHEILKPLVTADPQILSRMTQSQLDQAVSLAEFATHYSLNPATPGLYARHRLLRSKVSSGHDYPEWRQALVLRARNILLEPALKGDRPAHLVPIPEEKRPTKIIRDILTETFAAYKKKQEELKAASPENQKKLAEQAKEIQSLLFSLLSATGKPVAIQGQTQMISVTHDQLPVLLKELHRRKVEASVAEALVRSFPLGESLWRMGIPALWKKGLTGKGVKVAVIDNGVDPEHPDLANAVSKVVNFTRDRGDHAKGDHATPMADIVHAIAPDAEILSYQALSNTALPGVTLDGEETSQAVLNSLEAAEKDGAQIINLSLGAAGGYSSDLI